MRKITLVLAAAALFSAGCATQTATPSAATSAAQPVTAAATSAADEASANAAIAAAESARAAADAVGYEWRDTAQMIADAKEAVAAKDFEKATKLARQAERQGKDALAQYQQQDQAYKNH